MRLELREGIGINSDNYYGAQYDGYVGAITNVNQHGFSLYKWRKHSSIQLFLVWTI